MMLSKYTNKNLKVLIVEDCDIVRGSMARLLGKIYDVYKAEDGAIACSILEDTDIDVIMTDINMPNLCGNGLIQFVASRENSPFIPFIIATAYPEVLRCYANRDNIMVHIKPVNLFDIVEQIDRLSKLDMADVSNKEREELVNISKVCKEKLDG